MLEVFPFSARVTTRQWTGGRSECWFMKWQPDTHPSTPNSPSKSMKRLWLARWAVTKNAMDVFESCLCDRRLLLV